MPTRQRYSVFLTSAAIAVLSCNIAASETLLLNPASAESAAPASLPALPSANASQPAPQGVSTLTAPAPTLAEKRAENAEHLQIATQKLQAAGSKDAAATQEVAFYQTRGAVLAQQEAAEQQIKDLQSRKADIEAYSKKPLGDKKFKFADLDRMKDDLASEESRAGLLADRLAAAQSGLQRAKSNVDDCQAKWQRAQSDYENGKSDANASELALAATRAQQNATLANETLTLRTREVEREQLGQEVSKMSITARQAFIAFIKPQVKFTEQDYKEQLDDIAHSEESARAKLEHDQINLRSEEIELQNAKAAFQAAPDDSKDRPVLLEAFKAHLCAKSKSMSTLSHNSNNCNNTRSFGWPGSIASKLRRRPTTTPITTCGRNSKRCRVIPKVFSTA